MTSKVSSMSITIVQLVVIVLACIFWIFMRRRSRTNRKLLPPGPRGDPIIGHLRMIPSEGQGDFFHGLAKEYGDIVYLSCLGRDIIVLNSVDVAHELMEKRSANYSCRPDFPIFEVMGWGPTLTFLQYGKQFFKHRKFFQNYFGHQQSLAFTPLQAEEAKVLAKYLMLEPDDPTRHLSRFTTAVIMRIAFGHQISSNDDVYLQIAKDVSHAVHNCGSPGNTPVDLFPILRRFPSWFPGTYYCAHARSCYGMIRRLHDLPMEAVQKRLAEGTARPCFATTHLEQLNEIKDSLSPAAHEEEFNDIKGAAATVYSAGADTTFATLSVFLLLMTIYPEYQQKAQEEIHAVVGADRLPEYSDRESLPYVQCILWETLRWYPVVTAGIPHRTLDDDFYGGMFIPKGSIVIANSRGMSLDERVYADPNRFYPSRFLPKPHGNGEPSFTAIWGFGRRICPGRFMAEMSLWMAMATILATLDVRRVKDEDGRDIIPECKFTTGLVNEPAPFKCDIQPRSEKARNLVMMEA